MIQASIKLPGRTPLSLSANILQDKRKYKIARFLMFESSKFNGIAIAMSRELWDDIRIGLIKVDFFYMLKMSVAPPSLCSPSWGDPESYSQLPLYLIQCFSKSKSLLSFVIYYQFYTVIGNLKNTRPIASMDSVVYTPQLSEKQTPQPNTGSFFLFFLVGQTHEEKSFLLANEPGKTFRMTGKALLSFGRHVLTCLSNSTSHIFFDKSSKLFNCAKL
ncbi:hypothetical protein PHYBLDRAFT_72359 [Phycomyces blakesleeanus NRRL 1555(-)]|uniref:Uncharacterized protein n=1 Tax=Phycomyces blakesleeanus (strain ATCC 8743b / DSM 1359 / FGSC 10004 / NBRC 33097 / NRRL 1555) TaxID=763407 RepID=A0A162N4A7_PHYB8|nr:hypothetical protein PHYBLDRAFT_72359 [Phycomyces blakesleeanus NRRL 1555(-)]OAD65724.1 hypothetical protein PHYBLDRAFT_72359 [Phycomyces blakesleeanus NRRL 1555(-)]|eukprot:XP_018283764.1 hypothetical protein PHYBLDRAFT_72359 [Phycomyces blakesleeanus NRRL 1555(-)]